MLFNFNANQVEPNAGLEPIPAGTYPVIITDSSTEENSGTAGSHIKLELTIQPGNNFAGRKLYTNLNVDNPNPDAVKIAYGTLSAICRVIGRMEITQTEQLHGVPFQVIVIVDKNGYNNVKGIRDMQGNDPAKKGGVPNGGAQQTQQQQQPANGYTQQPSNVTQMPAPGQGGYQSAPATQGYGAPTPPPPGSQQQPPPPPPDPSASWQRSPDNAYKLNPNTNAWEPNTPPAQQPPPPPSGPSYGQATQPAQQPAQTGVQPGWSQGQGAQPGNGAQPGWVKP